MDIIKESPLCFTDGEEKEKAGNIYWDREAGVCTYWQTDTAWQYIPKELVDSIQNEINACTALVKENEKDRKQISELKKDIRNAAGVAGALRDERDAGEKVNKALGQDVKDALNTSKGVKKELRETTEALGGAQNDVKGMVKIMKLEAKDLAQALDRVGTLEREAKRAAGAHDLDKSRIVELEEAARVIALNPEDVVDLRATCTVDEVLRMRAAGVL